MRVVRAGRRRPRFRRPRRQPGRMLRRGSARAHSILRSSGNSCATTTRATRGCASVRRSIRSQGAGVVIPTGCPMMNASVLVRRSDEAGERGPMLRLLTLSLSAATLLCVIILSETATADDARYAQYSPPPPPGYYPPPCQAVTRGPFRGAARGAAGGALFGAIGGNAGKGAAIGAGVGAVAGAVRRGSARASGACY